MKRNAVALIVMATGMLIGSAAYAQAAHDHGAAKAEPGATQGHDAHCCKPDPNDTKSMPGMAGHDHAQVQKKPAKKPAEKAAKEKSPATK